MALNFIASPHGEKQKVYPEDGTVMLRSFSNERFLATGTGVHVGGYLVTSANLFEGSNRFKLMWGEPGLEYEFQDQAPVLIHSLGIAIIGLPPGFSRVVPQKPTCYARYSENDFVTVVGYQNTKTLRAPGIQTARLMQSPYENKLAIVSSARWIRNYGCANGGAVLNDKGELIGIANKQAGASHEILFATPIGLVEAELGIREFSM